MACLWRKQARRGKNTPADVPPGHLAVTVGEAKRRFVIRADYMNHPVFQQLLEKAYEEYGFNKKGPLAIPCDECLFEDIIKSLRGVTATNPGGFSCHLGLKKQELRPLIQGFDSKP